MRGIAQLAVLDQLVLQLAAFLGATNLHLVEHHLEGLDRLVELGSLLIAVVAHGQVDGALLAIDGDLAVTAIHWIVRNPLALVATQLVGYATIRTDSLLEDVPHSRLDLVLARLTRSRPLQRLFEHVNVDQ